jgi:hypothetical protein
MPEIVESGELGLAAATGAAFPLPDGIAFLPVERPEIEVGLLVVGVDRQQPLVALDGVAVAAKRRVDARQQREGIEVVGLPLHHLGTLRARVGELAGTYIERRQPETKHRRLRIGLHRLLERRDRGVHVVLLQGRLTADEGPQRHRVGGDVWAQAGTRTAEPTAGRAAARHGQRQHQDGDIAMDITGSAVP